jgi:hypothetical protein
MRMYRILIKNWLLKIDESERLYAVLSKAHKTCLDFYCLLFVQSSLASLEKRREKIAIELADTLEFTVKYGPFKGLRLSSEFNWGKSDIAPMLLGTYEQNLLDFISTRKTEIRNFINLGAGDGYYAAGMLFSRLSRFTYAYEMNETSRDLIRFHMEINNLKDNFQIRKIATSDFLSDFTDAELQDSLILVDIEGGEYELFKAVDMTRLTRTLVIIELHEFVDRSDSKVADLLLKLSLTHSLTLTNTGSRNLDGFEELEGMPDSDRWLLISEGRPKNMKWVLCEPKTLRN